jgi:undecaprenyl diphosphate synthase
MNQRQMLKFVLPIIVIVGLLIAGSLQWCLYDRKGECLQDILKKRPIKHLGVIMDGNRRWAKARGLQPWIGHKHGLENLRMTVKFCRKYNIPYLTVYAFSLENFKRPEEELNFLFGDVVRGVAYKDTEDLEKNGVRIQFVGDVTQFPPKTIEMVNRMTERTAHNKDLILTILFCYGGQQEIVNAVRALCAEVVATGKSPATISAQDFERHLWSGQLPALDLVIRTGCVSRLSNFLLYKIAYSDIAFVDCYWPNFTEQMLEQVIREFIGNTHRLCGA